MKWDGMECVVSPARRQVPRSRLLSLNPEHWVLEPDGIEIPSVFYMCPTWQNLEL